MNYTGGCVRVALTAGGDPAKAGFLAAGGPCAPPRPDPAPSTQQGPGSSLEDRPARTTRVAFSGPSHNRLAFSFKLP